MPDLTRADIAAVQMWRQIRRHRISRKITPVRITFKSALQKVLQSALRTVLTRLPARPQAPGPIRRARQQLPVIEHVAVNTALVWADLYRCRQGGRRVALITAGLPVTGINLVIATSLGCDSPGLRQQGAVEAFGLKPLLLQGLFDAAVAGHLRRIITAVPVNTGSPDLIDERRQNRVGGTTAQDQLRPHFGEGFTQTLKRMMQPPFCGSTQTRMPCCSLHPKYKAPIPAGRSGRHRAGQDCRIV